jgi:hypothetical protein
MHAISKLRYKVYAQTGFPVDGVKYFYSFLEKWMTNLDPNKSKINRDLD